MKKLSFLSLVLSAIILFPTCVKKNNDQSSSKLSPTQQAQLAKMFEDSTLSNIEMNGQFLYNHLKYHMAVDMSTLSPGEKIDPFLPNLRKMFTKYSVYSNREVLDDLRTNNYITTAEKNYLTSYSTAITQYFGGNPAADETSALTFLGGQERIVRNDATLTYNEKYALLLHHTLVRYAIKWYMERYVSPNTAIPGKVTTGTSGAPGSTISTSIWSTIACYAGSIASYVGIATAFAGTTVLVAAIGAALGAANAAFTCDGSSKNVCQDPLTVSTPYQCYTYGNALTWTAVGYGNTKPAQFVFSFADNDNLNNALYSNFTSNPYISLPGSYLTSSITDLAVQCKTSCSAGNPLWFGWFKLSDLGKPYFTISGTANMTVAQAAYYPTFEYDLSGPVYNTNATISWQIIPSGYPNYSATGTFNGPPSGTMVFIHWNASAGFATLACTATVGCASVTNYYTIHIQ